MRLGSADRSQRKDRKKPRTGGSGASWVPWGGTCDGEGLARQGVNLVTQQLTSMKVGLTAHEPSKCRKSVTASENVPKIRDFCPGTAILDELHWTVADGAIRELAGHGEYAPYVGSHRPAMTGG